MPPLTMCIALSHGLCYYYTGNIIWAIAGGLCFLNGPYTKIFMMGDIETLRKEKADSKEEVLSATTRFCNRHDPRTIVGLTAFGLSLYALMI